MPLDGGTSVEAGEPQPKTRKPRSPKKGTPRPVEVYEVKPEKERLRSPHVHLTVELMDQICSRIALGESLRAICRDENMPAIASVMRWLMSDEALCLTFREQYARAKEVQADSYEDMMLEEARNEEDVQRARLIVDTMKWSAAKLKPKKYGDKIQHDGEINHTHQFKVVDDRYLEDRLSAIITIPEA